MFGFINCLIYLILSGAIIFFIGRVFPRSLIKENSFPFNSFKFEKEGKIYDKINIKNWKTKLPDASVVITKILPKFMPIKRIKSTSKVNIETLIKETCVAETTHVFAGLSGVACWFIWKTSGGKILSIVYFLFNIPFIIIQRYNRPRLKLVNSKIKEK